MNKMNSFSSTSKCDDSVIEKQYELKIDDERIAYGSANEVVGFYNDRKHLDKFKDVKLYEITERGSLDSWGNVISGKYITKYNGAHYTSSVVRRYEDAKSSKISRLQNRIALLEELNRVDLTEEEINSLNVILSLSQRLLQEELDREIVIPLEEF